MMEDCFKNLNALNSEIAIKLTQIKQLQYIKEQRELEKDRKLQELHDFKTKYHEIKTNLDSLKERKIVVRERLNDVDKETKEKRSILKDKSIYKALGIKMHFEEFIAETDGQQHLDPSLLQIRFEFLKTNGDFLTIVYDTFTDDYDLFEMRPTHHNFSEMRELLRSTKDIQGLLSTFVRVIESNHQIDKNNI